MTGTPSPRAALDELLGCEAWAVVRVKDAATVTLVGGPRSEVESLLDVAVSRMVGTGPAAHQVWLPPLDVPDTLDQLLPDLAEDPQLGLVSAQWRALGGLVVPLGTVDRPRDQRRDTLTINLSGSAGHVAVVGGNRKLLVFPASDLPEMGRGKGVRLQRYKDGGLADAVSFTLGAGLSWKDPAGRTRTVGTAELAEWIGPRAGAGRMAPRGFPRENRFD